MRPIALVTVLTVLGAMSVLLAETPSFVAADAPTPEETQPVNLLRWGDNNCDLKIDGLDVLAVLAFEVRFLVPPNYCDLNVGTVYLTYGYQRAWGDVLCVGSVAPEDALALLAYISQSALATPTPIGDCPAIGHTVELG